MITCAAFRRDARVVEEARLESVYISKELSLPADNTKPKKIFLNK